MKIAPTTTVTVTIWNVVISTCWEKCYFPCVYAKQVILSTASINAEACWFYFIKIIYLICFFLYLANYDEKRVMTIA